MGKDTKEVLLRLKRRFGRERGRCVRGYAMEGVSQSFKDRCYYEETQWSLAMGMIDDELKKLVKGE